MANESILNLPVAIGLTGEEYFPLVQGGTTKRAQTSLLTGIQFNLDSISTTQGAILYRGLNDWVALDPGTAGYVLTTGGAAANPSWVANGTGTVSSVAMSVPSFLSVAGSPITSTGTLAVTLATQTANTVFAGPTTGIAATPTFRALVAADVPASAIQLTVGSTVINSGTTTRILYDNAGTLGEYTLTGTGTVVAMATGPTLVSPVITTSPTAAGATWTNLGSVTTVDINGGDIDNTIIGGSVRAAAAFTTAIANAFIPDGASVPSNGMYLPAANTLGWAINSAAEVQLTASAFSPAADGGNSLGTTALGWQNLFGNTGFVLNIENGDYTVTHSTGLLTFSGGITATGGTVTLGTVAGAIDMGGATSLEIPNSAAPTVNADGEIALDTTVTDFAGGVVKYYSGAEYGLLGMPVTEFVSPSDGDVVTYNAATDEFLLLPAGAGTGATRELNNLQNVAINTSLISDTDVTDDLGSLAIRWNNVYAARVGTGDTAADVLNLSAYNTGGAAFTNFMTLTAHATTPTATLSNVTSSTNFNPTSNDGGALGTTALSWSDLFLASGALINWNNGNATITHSAGLLTTNVPVTITGVATADGFAPTANTATGNRVYLPAANTLGFAINGSGEVQLTASALSPISNDGNALGTSSLGWADAFFATGGILDFGAGNATITHSTGFLTANVPMVSPNFASGYTTTATAAGTTTLTVASTEFQFFTGSTTQTVVLPVTSTLVTGLTYTVVNNSTGVVTVQSSGANNALVMGPQSTAEFICILTSGTTAASWNVRTAYANIPQNSQSAAYTTVLSDAGKHILHPTADNNARTFTIDSNANVPYPVGTAITFVNQINTVTIAITSDTLTFAGVGTTGSRSLAASGMATALKIASTSWIISGTGLT